jgi:hypothetical protein
MESNRTPEQGTIVGNQSLIPPLTSWLPTGLLPLSHRSQSFFDGVHLCVYRSSRTIKLPRASRQGVDEKRTGESWQRRNSGTFRCRHDTRKPLQFATLQVDRSTSVCSPTHGRGCMVLQREPTPTWVDRSVGSVWFMRVFNAMRSDRSVV